MNRRERLAERKAKNKARWAAFDEMRRQAWAAASGEPKPPDMSAATWEILAAGARKAAKPVQKKPPGIDPYRDWGAGLGLPPRSDPRETK